MKTITLVKGLAFAAALLPAAALVRNFYANDLTANPGEYLTRETGTWALALLTVSLGVTPLRRLTKWNAVIKLRRMLGLFAFFYALLHVLTWIVLIHYFEVTYMLQDVLERPFITVGMMAFLILLALAVTSNQLSIRALGRRWQLLHRLAYVAAIGSVIHFLWLVKADTTLPVRWAVALGLLLSFRVWWVVRPHVLSRS